MVNFLRVDVEDELTLGATHVLRTADAGHAAFDGKSGRNRARVSYNRYINRLRETDPEAAENELRPSVLDMME